MEASGEITCDCVAGELIYFFTRTNRAAANLLADILEGGVELVEVLENIADRIRHMGQETSLTLDFYQAYVLKVPDGDEVTKINSLYQLYTQKIVSDGSDTSYMWLNGVPPIGSLWIVQNSLYKLGSPLAETSSTTVFAFTSVHQTYKALINPQGLMADPAHKKPVLIIDSGLDPQLTGQLPIEGSVISMAMSDEGRTSITDHQGHGSAMARMINDVSPTTPLHIIKVQELIRTPGADRLRIPESTLLSALCTETKAAIINLSLVVGISKDRDCGQCGRMTVETRSVVLELVLGFMHQVLNQVVVASAGNDNKNELSFPAKFSTVLAVCAVNSNRQISDFSNRGVNTTGAVSTTEAEHKRVFVVPGGNRQPEELIFTGGRVSGYGTSQAAAYTSGLLSILWSRYPNDTAEEIINRLAADHTTSIFFDNRTWRLITLMSNAATE